jgi:hypothetical protein
LLFVLSAVPLKMHSAHTGYFTFGSQNEHAGLTLYVKIACIQINKTGSLL